MTDLQQRLASLPHAWGKPMSTWCEQSFPNNCAHWVTHFLELKVPSQVLCHKGYPTVVSDIWEEADWKFLRPAANFKPTEATLCVVLGGSLLRGGGHLAKRMNEMPHVNPAIAKNQDPANLRHVGIYFNGMVYHFGNTAHKVVRNSLEDFAHLYDQYTKHKCSVMYFVPLRGLGVS